ncbi:MAG TPA: Maf family protein [Woeseiaceae bacterium]|nr:Maf family protein [Woeseiaceae bacterium]
MAKRPTTKPVLHLASASPRRREILTALGVRHTWEGVDIDETPSPGEPAEALVLRLALGKARASRDLRPNEQVILGADTIVSLDERIFGKSATEGEALCTLSQLSGRTHKVFTAVALSASGRELTALCQSDVRLRRIEPREALAYWRSGEPAGKAGAYAIQGVGGIFVEGISGSYSGIVGLPVFETAALLAEAGIDLLRGAGVGEPGP